MSSRSLDTSSALPELLFGLFVGAVDLQVVLAFT
jgi:hypothetical protein